MVVLSAFCGEIYCTLLALDEVGCQKEAHRASRVELAPSDAEEEE